MCIRDREDTKVIIDPIMGDHGETYATYTPAMCSRMKELVSMGDIVTPNLTEACICLLYTSAPNPPIATTAWWSQKYSSSGRNGLYNGRPP